MGKYILPLVIVVGLVVIIGYSQLANNSNSPTKQTLQTTPTASQQKPNLSTSPTSTSSSVPLPTSEDAIKTFFRLINEKKVPEVINMMTNEMVGNESSKQAWGVQFNNINSIALKTIEPAMQEDWPQGEQEYQVVLDVKMNPESANAPIPYYGWDNGENMRWIIIKKIDTLWKISSISTGP